MTREQIKTYYEIHEQFSNGEISENNWRNFCDVLLEEIMQEHKDVFLRLKESGQRKISDEIYENFMREYL